MAREAAKAVAYLRTSSKTNIGPDKDSDKRQQAAIEAFAKANRFEIVATFYDAEVSGADPVTDRPGFAEMLERLLSNGARTIIVESPDRFARDLMVQLAGHDMLKAKGITLIAASAPTFFIEDTPTAVLVRQVLSAVAQFEKATTVAKLAAARKRKRATGVKVEGRKSLAETNGLRRAFMFASQPPSSKSSINSRQKVFQPMMFMLFTVCSLQVCRLSFFSYVIKLGLAAKSSMGGGLAKEIKNTHRSQPAGQLNPSTSLERRVRCPS